MAQLNIINNNLEIKLSLLEKVLTLKSAIEVNLRDVKGATHDSGYFNSGIHLRLFGSALGSIWKIGTFRSFGQKAFVLWHKNQDILVVEITNQKYQRIIIGCDNAEQLAMKINNLISKNEVLS